MGAGVSYFLACFFSFYFQLLTILSQLLTNLGRRRMRRVNVGVGVGRGGRSGDDRGEFDTGILRFISFSRIFPTDERINVCDKWGKWGRAEIMNNCQGKSRCHLFLIFLSLSF